MKHTVETNLYDKQRSHAKEPSATNRSSTDALKDKLPFFIAMGIGVACYVTFFRRGLGLSVIGYSISPAERVMHGEVPYRDFLFNYTPGVLWVNALLMQTFGPTLMTIRVGLFVFKMLTLAVLFLLAKRLTSAWAALVPVVLALAWLGHRQVFNVYPDQYLILFALLAMSLMLDYNRSGKARFLLLSGIATGLVFLFKHNVGIFLVAAATSSIALREWMTAGHIARARRFPAIAIKAATYLLGFAVVTGALAAYLVYHRALGAMIEHFLHHAVEYGETRAVMLPPLAQLKTAGVALLVTIAAGVLVFYRARKLFSTYLVAVLVLGSAVFLIPGRAYAFKESALASVAYFPIAVFVASLVAAILQIRRALKGEGGTAEWWMRNGAIAIVALFAFGVYLEVFPRADTYHLVRVLPVVLLFFFILLVRSLPAIRESLGTRLPKPRRDAILAVSLPLCFLLLAGLLDSWRPQFDSKLHLKDKTELSIERARGILVEKRQAELAEGLVRLIENNSASDDPIFSFSQRGSSLYFLAGRKNPSRLLWWNSAGIKKAEREAVISVIEARVPKLIVVQDIPANNGIRDFISSYYNHLGTVTDIAVYGRIQ